MLTELEYQAEYAYRVTERLGMICGRDDPYEWHVRLAQQEAEAALVELERVQRLAAALEVKDGICDSCGKEAQYLQVVDKSRVCRACLETEPL